MDEALGKHVLYSVKIAGKEIPFITDTVVVTWIIMAAIMILALVLTRSLKPVPKGKQVVAETVVGFFNNFSKDQIGHHWRTFSPYIGTVMIYLVFANLISLVNIFPSGKFWAHVTGNESLEHWIVALEPPTRNFNVTLALALMTMAVVIWAEFRFKGVKGWARGFNSPINAFVKLLDYIVRPMSLCLRLFGNILGAVIVMTLIYSAAAVVAPAVVSVYFDIFDGALQAYVFVFLTSVYIAEAVE